MDFLHKHLAEIVAGLAVLAAIQLIMLIGANSRLNRMNKTVRQILSGPGGEDLEAMLKRSLGESRHSLARCDDLEEQLGGATAAMRGCVQKIGMVRYDAFGDVSGAQSFSLALLDDHNSGAILTGLLGRHDGRCFGKPVFDGQTEQALSEEESQALSMALGGGLKDSRETRASEKPSRRERIRETRAESTRG